MTHPLLTIALITIGLASCMSNRTEPFDLTQLPSEWVRLTETDTGLVVYNRCDAGNLQITFEDTTKILFHGEQEDDEFEISKVEKIENGAIKVTAIWKALNDKTTFNILWKNEKAGLIQINFKSLTREGDSFVCVDKRLVGNYPVVDQPCAECWPEEECD